MPSKHRFVTLDVFTSSAFGGNQLAVFPDASGIPEDALIRITREFNFAEVTFCYPPANPAHTKRVRIFTPAREIPFAGHPTVGTAIALIELGMAGAHVGEPAGLVLEEGVGPIPVTVKRAPGAAAFAQFSTARLAEVGPPAPGRDVLAGVLSIEPDDILAADMAPENVSCGLPFLLVPLRSVDAVRRSRVRMDKWETALKSAWAPDIFLFARAPSGGDADFHARMYGPGVNVPEDPATGSANACFAGYLAARAPQRDGTLRWKVDQGVEMGRPSRIEIEADKSAGAVTAIRVGGNAVMVTEGSLVL
ncbi:MAG TPA: PhzF family phenazine biosynthesis protein [Gemmatimonadaceae bacterium]|nr:PhzF family phenazine biosynthesis protein [Gemmatimonadaceae bacterium]